MGHSLLYSFQLMDDVPIRRKTLTHLFSRAGAGGVIKDAVLVPSLLYHYCEGDVIKTSLQREQGLT